MESTMVYKISSSLRIGSFMALLIFFFFPAKGQERLIDYVNPFIGTGGHGHTFPGATRPFGMVQLSPDNGTPGWDWSSGYHYSDNKIIGFSHTHISGGNAGEWLDISVMPLPAPLPQGEPLQAVTFSHANEHASPGYYSVRLDNGILAEFTASRRVGFHRYSFPKAVTPVIRFDMQFHAHQDIPVSTLVKKLNDSTVVGFRYSTGPVSMQRVYFAARTSEPFEEFYLNGEIQIEGGDMELGLSTDEQGMGAIAQLIFEKSINPHLIRMKVALSMTGIDQAIAALSEIPHWDFNQVKEDAEQEWEEELEKVKISTPDERLKTVFYTALYHTALAPNTFSDVQGQYKNVHGDTLRTENASARYTNLSLRNSYRTLSPLFTLIQPARYTAMLESLMSFYEANGVLPEWDLSTAEAKSSSGYHAVAVLADAILKKWPGIDQRKILEALKHTSDQRSQSMSDFIRLGYFPQDRFGYSVTRTLEYGFDDYSIARVAGVLGDSVTQRSYSKRASAYQQLFDKNTGFLRARNSDGAWALPFNPSVSQRDSTKAHYLEGNAWTNTFYAPHDIGGLAALYGNDGLEEKLDRLFNQPAEKNARAQAGQQQASFGRYTHNNPLVQHAPYLYNYLGKPWKTQELVRKIADSVYNALPDGYIGNEGMGQNSAWLIWTVAGMYPVDPVGGEYVIGSPIADTIRITVGNGKQIEIFAENNQPRHPYIQSVTLNGKAYDKTYFKHADLIAGAKVVFTMGPEPNKAWGVDLKSRPSSLTESQQDPAEPLEQPGKSLFERIKEFFRSL